MRCSARPSRCGCKRGLSWAGSLSTSNAMVRGCCSYTPERLRACFKIQRGPVFAEKAAWRDATKEHSLQRSVTEEQRSQAAFSAKTRRAAGLLAAAGVGSALTARCGDARASPPWLRPKSLAAGPLSILKQALRSLQGDHSVVHD